ncbi:MAG TPA: GNAT family N-acetyltransferase [Phycisphaerales bacterium]|nr:GNAT family N-acetyltransferase [Phycisphaerales bacterium]
MDVQIRRLTAADTGAYAALRREGLADTPHAFTASDGDDPGQDEAGVARSLAGPGYAIFGAFAADGRLVGAAGINRETRLKRAHRAWVWGVYVTPAFRGRGLARGLVGACVDAAKGWDGVHRVQLSVSATSDTARRVYESLGFVAWGTEIDALRTGGKSYDEVYMSLAI